MAQLHCTMTLLHSTMAISLYLTLLHYYGSTWLYFILPCSFGTSASTQALLHHTWLYFTLPSLYFTLFDSASIYHSWLYLQLALSITNKVLLHSDLLDSPSFNHGSTSLYHNSTSFYDGSTSLHLTLLNQGSTLLYHHSIKPYLTLFILPKDYLPKEWKFCSQQVW